MSKFVAYKSWGSGEETFFIRHMILCDQVIMVHVTQSMGSLNPKLPL